MSGNYSLGVYEKAMPDSVALEKKLYYAQKAGFDFLELSIDESEGRLTRLDWPVSQRAALLDASRNAGIRIDTMCLSGHRKYPLGSSDLVLSGRGLDILQKAVALAADLGIRIIQLAGYDVYYETSTAETVKRFENNLYNCVEIAAAAGVMLGFETMETPFMNTTKKAMYYVKKVGSPWLQVYPDVGNITNGTEDLITDLQSGRGHITAAHLKETKPGVFRDLFPGEGRVNFPLAVSELKKLGVHKYNAEFWYRPGDNWQKRLRDMQNY